MTPSTYVGCLSPGDTRHKIKNAAPFKSQKMTVNLDNDFSEWEDVKRYSGKLVRKQERFSRCCAFHKIQNGAARNNVTEINCAG